MSKYSTRKVKPSTERLYEVLRKPVITEKATLMSEFNQVSFYVSLDASKPEIKAAVEELVDGNAEFITTAVAEEHRESEAIRRKEAERLAAANQETENAAVATAKTRFEELRSGWFAEPVQPS